MISSQKKKKNKIWKTLSEDKSLENNGVFESKETNLALTLYILYKKCPFFIEIKAAFIEFLL